MFCRRISDSVVGEPSLITPREVPGLGSKPLAVTLHVNVLRYSDILTAAYEITICGRLAD